MINYQKWQTINGEISKIKLSSTLEDAADLFNNYLCTLKRDIFIKRVQHKKYSDLKSALPPSSLLIHVDFADSYTNYQQNATKSVYFGQENFSIFTVVWYCKKNKHLVNDRTVVVSDVSDHFWVGSMSYLDKVGMKIEEK